MISKRRVRVDKRMNVVQRLENCRRAEKTSGKPMEKFLEKMGDIMHMKSNIVRQLRKGYSLDHRIIVILLELSLVMVVERICGVKIPGNTKQSRGFETFVTVRYCPKIIGLGRLTMLQNVRC